MREKPTPGEWQTESNGFGGVRRFRMVGNVKEYEMMVKIDGIEIPESMVSEYNRRKAASNAARRDQENARPAPKSCPLSTALNTKCTGEECAFYSSGCGMIHYNGSEPAGRCPISHTQCSNDCIVKINNKCKILERLGG